MNMPRRGALIGYGFIAENGHLPVYIERADRVGDVVISAIADVTPARRSAAHRALPSASIYASYDELLQMEASRLDFVDIATPPYCHAEIANAALDRGLHVLCEKPLAFSFGEAQGMAERARLRRRVLFPCHNYRHAPVIRTVRELVERGAIGSVHLATLQTFRTTHARGVREWRPDWRRDGRFSGGGIGMDHGPHSLYLAFEWLRAYPSAVTASMSNALGVDTEDTFHCTLTFPTAVATVMLTWSGGARKVMYTLHGSRGAISVDDDDIHLVLRHDNDRPHDFRNFLDRRSVSSKWMDASHKEWFGSVLDAFGRSIEGNDLVSRDTLDAIECMRIISAAYTSVRQASRQVDLRSARA
jgi:myo-inositol 2-dehydrogenase / D-chiro-inositol 1-dehydrogenase